MNIDPKSETQSPDKQHFDKMLLKELVWKLDREVWAHVQNPSPNEEWSTSKAREETRNLISEYIGNYDALQSENQRLTEERDKLQKFKEYVHERLDKMGIEKDPESIHKEAGCRIGGRLDIVERITKINEELVKACQLYMRIISDEGCIPDMEQIELTDKMQSALKKAKSNP